MRNQQVSDVFNEMADIMEIVGEDHFRINTYRKVARVIKDCPCDITTLAAAGTLQELDGIGKSSAEKIIEFVSHGLIQAHQELLRKIPASLLDLLKIPGMGPKTVTLVWKKLNVTNLDELQKAIDQKEVESLGGLGAKKAETIARGIKFIQSSHGRVLLPNAIAIAQVITEELSKLASVQKIESVGSIRRCCETVGDIDLLAQADNSEEIIETFTHLPGVQQILAAGKTKASVHFTDPEICSDVVQVDLRVISAESIGSALQYFTGSKYHNTHLREIAVKKKLKLNEYGLFKDEKQIAGKTEHGIYKALGLAYIQPVLREDRGEIELALQNKLPALVDFSDIKGDLHIHSPASDGRSPVEYIITAAQKLGYEYIAISDHSRSSAIANGLDTDRLLTHIKYIRDLNKKTKNLTILASSEVDILPDGSLDYPDEILAELDFVIASVHSGMTGSQEKLTKRVMRAMENPYVNCLGHPTGRMINVREPMQLDMRAIIARAVRTGTALEINSHPIRLDLKDVHVRLAVDAGAKFFINTDAHDIAGVNLIHFGLTTAQRGWAKKSDILNCQPISTIQKWVKSKRKTIYKG